jgi:hypothetical protein
LGLSLVTKQVVKGVTTQHGGRGRVCERDMARVRVGHGMAGQNYCVVGGCLLSLSLCRRGLQDMLKVRPSSLLILAYDDRTERMFHQHIKFRHRGITQKKAYNIQNTAKV